VTGAEVVQNAHDFPITRKNTAGIPSRQSASVAAIEEATRHFEGAAYVVKAVRDFLDNEGFTLCDTPIFTPAACEGTTPCSKLIILATRKPISRNQVSFITKLPLPPLAKSIPLAHVPLKNQRRADI